MSLTVQEYALEKPQTPEQVQIWVREFFGFDLHTCVRCTPPKDMSPQEAVEAGLPHQNQLDYVCSCFLKQHSGSLLTGSRGGGKSQCIAVVSMLFALFYPGIFVLDSAFTQDMADEVYFKSCAFMQHYKNVTGIVPHPNGQNKNTWIFKNGSKIQFRTGFGKTNVASLHPQVLFIDEVDKFKANQIATLEHSVVAGDAEDLKWTQVNCVSTSYSMSDESVVSTKIEAFNEFNRDKPEHMLPQKIFRICLLDILQTCDDRYQCYNEKTGKNCMLWDFCQGKAKDIKGGYYPIDVAIKHISSDTSRQSFDAEMLLQQPIPTKAYFKSFGKQHILEVPLAFNPAAETFIAFDFGGIRCAHAAVIAQRDLAGVFYVIDEFESKGNFENLLYSIKSKYPGIERHSRCFYDPAGNKKDMMLGSKSYKDLIVAAGWAPRFAACKRQETFDLLQTLISPADGKEKFKINKSCRNLIKQIRSATRKSDGKPEDGAGDDLLDCLRYICYWVMKATPRADRRWVYS